MPEWWRNLMEWMDNVFIPVWVIVLVVLAWLGWNFWRDLKAINHDPPPYD